MNRSLSILISGLWIALLRFGHAVWLRRFSVAATCGIWILSSSLSLSIVDTNHNGLSDLWEKQYNNDELFPETFDPETFDPEADPDADGWTNAEEAAAGTDPFDPSPPHGLLRPTTAHTPATWGDPDLDDIPAIITPETITVSWPTIPGKQYTLLASTDLTSTCWMPVDESFIGNGNLFEYHFTLPAAERIFWKVAVTDADSDGDGLTDAEEHELGTNPKLADSDGDGLTDGYEVARGSNPLEEHSDDDGIPDGLDADPSDNLVNWERVPEGEFVYLDVTVPPGSEFWPRDFNDRSEVLFDTGIWAGGSWIALDNAPEVTGECTYMGEETTFTSNSTGWQSFNNNGHLLGWSGISFTSGQHAGGDGLYSAQFWNQAQTPSDLGALIPMFEKISPMVRPLGISSNGNKYVAFDYLVPVSPTDFDTVGKIAVFSPPGDNVTLLEGQGGANIFPNYWNFGVSPAGWSAANVGEPNGSTGSSYHLEVWNPQLASVPLPASAIGFHLPLHLNEVQDVKTIIAGGNPSGGNVFLPDDLGIIVRANRLSGKQIHSFAGDGTAITNNGNLWRNGKLVSLSSLSDGYRHRIEEDWNISPIKGNKHGAYLVAVEGPQGENGAGLLFPVEVVSRDKFLAGSFRIPESFEDLEVEFGGHEELGRYGDFFGGGTTNVFSSVQQILDPEEGVVTQPENQNVWFVRDSTDPRIIYYYTCYSTIGDAEIKFHLPGANSSDPGVIKHPLLPAEDFAKIIAYVDAWVKGTSFGGPGAGTTWLTITGADLTGIIANHTRAGLIPYFDVIDKVAGLTPLLNGLCDGVRQGLEDDKEFVALISSAVATSAEWVQQNALDGIALWTNPTFRTTQLLLILDHVCQQTVFPFAGAVKQRLSNWEGFRKEAWKTWKSARKLGVNIYVANQAIRAKIVEGILSWADDFCTRMMAGAEKDAWDSTPWEQSLLISEVARFRDRAHYTFGYTFGYLCEQAITGAVTAGAFTVGKLTARGAVSMVTNLAPRAKAITAVRLHYLKGALANFALMDDGLRPAYEGMMSSMGRLPTSPTIKEIPASLMENRMSPGTFTRYTFNFNEWVKTATKNGNVRKLIASPGGRDIFSNRTSQLMHLLDDQCDATTMKNFMKAAEEKLVLDRGQGVVDEWFEDFFRVFKGNPSEYVNRPPLDDLSENGIQRIKNFLGEPNPGYAWKFEEGLETQWKAPIVRGILVEIDLWHRIYKPAGWTHLPIEEAVDFIQGIQALQVKSIGTVNPNRIVKLKEAVQALRNYGVNNGKTDLILDIRKKPGLDTSQLEQELDDYILDLNPSANGLSITVNYSDYDFIPNL